MYANEILAQAYRTQLVEEAEHARLVRLAQASSGHGSRWSLSGLNRIFSIHPWRSISTPNIRATQTTLSARIR